MPVPKLMSGKSGNGTESASDSLSERSVVEEENFPERTGKVLFAKRLNEKSAEKSGNASGITPSIAEKCVPPASYFALSARKATAPAEKSHFVSIPLLISGEKFSSSF